MNLQIIKKLTLRNFGPFEGSHVVELPTNGLVLVKGRVTETEDGSGSGKSYLLKGISYLFGGCPDPGTEIKCWYTDEPPEAEVELETSQGILTIKRKKGLSISGGPYKETVKGKAVEAELDKIFGMDENSRAISTYRGQRKPGLFLSQSDEKKKLFLSNLLGLDVYQKVAEEAKKKIDLFEKACITNLSAFEFQKQGYQKAQEELEKAQEELAKFPATILADVLRSESYITDLRACLNTITREIDKVRQEKQIVLDAILGTVKDKIQKLAAVGEPIELTALRNELQKQQQRLEKVREFDNNAKLEVQKQRSKLQLGITEKKAKVSERLKLEVEIRQLQQREGVLRQQKCSECKREWVGPESEKVLQQVTEQLQLKLAAFDNIKDAGYELSELEKQLREIVEPAPHPAGQQVVERINVLNQEIKDTLQKSQSERKDKLNALSTEEREIRAEFTNTLAQELQDIKAKETEAQNALDCAINENKTLVATKTSFLAQQAVVDKLVSQVQSQKGNLDKAITEKEKSEKELNLEKDVFALVGRQGFLGTIFEEVLAEIAAIANETLSQVSNVRHLSVDFETEKEAANGNITTRITPVVYSRGRKVSFSSGISGGMQTAVELAIDLAVGDVVSRRRGFYPGFLILDESFDGLGGTAKESCLEMLQQTATTKLVLVVDHDASFQGLFHSVIEIEQTDGRSRII